MRDGGQVRWSSLGRSILLPTTVVGSLSATARGSADPLPVSLTYVAIEGCPSEDAFWSALASRASRVQRSSEAGRQLQVDIILTPKGVLGRLQIAREAQVTEPRFVEATDCAEVVQALALTAALSIEGELEARPPPDPPPETPDDSPYTDRRLPVDFIGDEPVTNTKDWETELHAWGLFAFLVDERPSVGAGGAVTFSHTHEGIARQTLGLAVGALTTGAADADTTARFTLTQAELLGCPLVFSRGVAFRPCAVFQVGILNATGQNLSDPQSEQGMWWAPGVSLRGEAPTDTLFRFQFALSAVVPLEAHTYQVGLTPETVARTLPVSPWLTLGVAAAPQ